SCNLVDGGRYLLYPIYLTRSVSMPANIDHATLTWSASERGIDFANPAFSCSLPPGVGIKTVEQDYKEDIGNCSETAAPPRRQSCDCDEPVVREFPLHTTRAIAL